MKIGLLLIGIALITFFVFAKALKNDFIWQDREQTYHSNPNFSDSTAKTLSNFWSKPYQGQYLPLTYTFWEFTKKVGDNQFKSSYFHFLNIFIHALCSLLVFLILLQFTAHSWGSAIGALLFSLHPLQVESVAYATQFSGVLASFCALVSMFMVKWNIKKTSMLKISFVYLFFLLALLANPLAPSLPLAFLLICYYDREHFSFKSFCKNYGATIVLSIIFITLIYNNQTAIPAANITPWWVRPILVGHTFNFYLFKLLVPYPLSASYGHTAEWLQGQVWFYLLFPFSWAGMAYLLYQRKKHHILFLCGGLFVVALLPVCGLFTFHFQIWSTVGDRFVHLAMLAPALGCAFLVKTLLSEHKSNFLFPVLLPLFILAVTSFMGIDRFKNEESLWKGVASKSSHQGKVHYKLGIIQFAKNNFKEALSSFLAVMKYTPQNIPTYSYLGKIYDHMEMFATAEIYYIKGLELSPKDYTIYNELGSIYIKQENYEEAEWAYQEALKINPNLVMAKENLIFLAKKIEEENEEY